MNSRPSDASPPVREPSDGRPAESDRAADGSLAQMLADDPDEPAMTPPKYKADDKSILLPYYKRFLIEPALPFIPARIHPNSITHLGHLLCLAGAAVLLGSRADHGWPFIVTAILVTAYVFCDNADGGHARRTGQTSPFGEFLDHGLDLFNTAYIGYMSATAMGADKPTWILIGFLIIAAAAAVYWEQAECGVFRLGLLSQLESSVLLMIALLIDAVFSTKIFLIPIVFGINARTAVLLWTLLSIASGMGRAMIRVGAKDLRRLAPILSQLALNGALIASYFLNALDPVPVVIVGSLANIAFGLRMLSFRLRREKPRVDLLFCATTVALAIAMVFHLDARWALALAVTGSVLFTIEGALATRAGLRSLRSA
jgi:phosphatidylglycerophosphate synthase